MFEILKISYTASISFVYLFIIAKLMGKKQIAQLDFIDYVVGISIGSIAAEMATDLEAPFYHYLISMTIFFVFDLIITIIGRKGIFLKVFLKGKPIILIKNGKIDYKQLKRSRIDVNDLIGLARSKDVFDLSQISYAVFETNGQLSILKNQTSTDATNNLPNYIIFDGKISTFALKQINKDENWLLKTLNPDNFDYKKIILATYIAENKQIIIDFKNKKEIIKYDINQKN